MRALDADSGEEYWTVPAPVPLPAGGFTSELAAVLFFEGPVIVYSIKSDNGTDIRLIYDAGSYEDAGIEAWSTVWNAFPFGSDRPAVMLHGPGSRNLLYQALQDGRTHQFDLASGAREARFITGGFGSGFASTADDGRVVTYRPYANSAQQLVSTASNPGGASAIKIGCGAYPVSYSE